VSRKWLYYIQANELAGFIEETGHVAISLGKRSYQSTGFSDGLCPFEQEGRFGFIDTSGAVLVEPTFSAVFEFSYGLAAVCFNQLWGFIDVRGESAIPFLFEDACGFCEDGMAIVQLNKKWGYIDRAGDFVIDPVFDEAYDFDGPLAKVEVDDKFGYIDRKGAVVWMQD
jgi:hypothetical protein